MKLFEIKLSFTPAPENRDLWRILDGDKEVGKIYKTKHGYETRVSMQKLTIRTLADSKKWASAVYLKDKSKLPVGTSWPFDE